MEEGDYKKILKSLVVTQTYIETLDEVKEISKFYKSTNKKRADVLSKELEKSLGRHFSKIYNRDDKSFGIVIESILTVAKWMSENSMEDISCLAEAMKNNELKFIENEK